MPLQPTSGAEGRANSNRQRAPLAAERHHVSDRWEPLNRSLVLSFAILMNTIANACGSDVPPPVGGVIPVPKRVPTREESAAVLLVRVRAITGAAPAECGRHFINAGRSELESSLQCAIFAARAKQPFWTFQQLQGIDSWVAVGFAAGPDGLIRYFSYDSSPGGGPRNDSRFRLTASPCARPSVVLVLVNGDERFSCSS